LRLQKAIANSGFTSRRKAEKLILDGKVRVNGEIIRDFIKVSDDDKIEVGNRVIKLDQERIYLKFFKPKNYVCTRAKFKNEKSIFDLLPKRFKDLKIGGRLDKDSEGLLLLSNDGSFILKTTHPRYETEKTYEVEFLSSISEENITTWSKGVKIFQEKFLPCSVKKLSDKKIKIILREGKKRQIRKIADFFGLGVKNLKRVSIGEVGLGKLKKGEFEIMQKLRF